jgi:hypothetical protein
MLAQGSATKMREEPEEEREDSAEEEAGDDREVEGSVFAAVDDVAWKFSEAEGEFCGEVEKSADKDEKAAKEEEENAAEFAKRLHPRILPEAAEKLFPSASFC